MQDRVVQTTHFSLTVGKPYKAWHKSHTLLEYNSNEKVWWNLDKSDSVNPEAETKGEFSE